jgi:prevent-host-death family protein
MDQRGPPMVKRVTAAQAKAQLSTLMAEVAYGGSHILIERRGKPLAALVGVADLERLEEESPTSSRPRGALALVGAWRDLENDEIDDLIAHIYAGREKDTGRPVDLGL